MKRDTLREALQIDYRLRSTFFYRKIHELGYSTLEGEINKLVEIGDNFNWEQRSKWDISETAWQIIINAQISPIVVFAHPRILQEQPALSTYYRNVAALSQKAVKKLALSKVDNVEIGKSDLQADQAIKLCQLYNGHSSLIIESAASYTKEDAFRLMLVSAGAQINGSWLNKIGEEAELVTRKLLIREALQRDYLISVIHRNGGTIELTPEELVDQADMLTGIRLKNQTSILFSSEPDLSFLNASGDLVAVVEIKGGKDTAGALERYGAAKKSFEEAKRQNADVKTIFLASCITSEVNKRLSEDRIVTYTYNLTDIIVDEQQRESFADAMFALLDMT